MIFCLPRRNDAAPMAPPRISYHQQSPAGIEPYDIQPFLRISVEIKIGVTIVNDLQSPSIIKDRASLRKRDAVMVSNVRGRFPVVPFEDLIPHDYGITVSERRRKADL